MALSVRHAVLAVAGSISLLAALVTPSGARPPTVLSRAVASATTTTSTTTSSTTTTVPPVPVLRHDATVTVAVSHLPRQLNPWTVNGSDPLASMIMAQVWPQSSIVDSHGNSTVCFAEVTNCPEPLFSTAEDVSVAPQTVEYVIDPKARWSDGVPVTGADFIALWHAVVARASVLPVTDPIEGYLDIASITSVGRGRTVTVIFKHPYADWPALFTSIPPSHITSKFGWEAPFSSADPSKILSAGPYRISRIVPGKVVILDRNPEFWGTAPSVKRIIFRVYPNERSILAGLESGSVTVAELPPGTAVNTAIASSLELAAQPVSAPVLWQLAFNVARPALSAAVVRQAIAKIVNRHEIIADTVGLTMSFGQTSGNRLFPAGAPGSQGNDGAYSAVDLHDATTLLAAAGDVTNADGFVHTAGGARLSLSLAVPRESATMRAAASIIQGELLAAGIGVRIVTVGLSQLLGKVLPTGQYDMALVPYPVSPYPTTTASLYLDPVGPTPPATVNATGTAPTLPVADASGTTPTTMAGSSSSTSTSTTTSPTAASSDRGVVVVLPNVPRTEPAAVAVGTVTRNVLGFVDPTLPGVFAQASTELNTAAELSLYDAIDTTLWADMPTLPLYQQPQILVTRIALVNVSQSSSASQFLWNAENWAVEANVPTPTTTTAAP